MSNWSVIKKTCFSPISLLWSYYLLETNSSFIDLYYRVYSNKQAYKKCSVCLGPSKVMGKTSCQICARSTHHKHIAWSPYERGSGQGHFDTLVQSAPIFEPFLCKYYYFLVLNIFCGVNFFSGTGGPRSCGFCRPANKRPGRSEIILGGRLIVSIFVARINPKMDDLGHFICKLIPSHIELSM